LSISTLAISDVAHLNQITPAPSALDEPAPHADGSLHLLAGTHDIAPVGAELNGELGSATLHDVLTSTFAHQIHI
jgi:hypothetical protein